MEKRDILSARAFGFEVRGASRGRTLFGEWLTERRLQASRAAGMGVVWQEWCRSGGSGMPCNCLLNGAAVLASWIPHVSLWRLVGYTWGCSEQLRCRCYIERSGLPSKWCFAEVSGPRTGPSDATDVFDEGERRGRRAALADDCSIEQWESCQLAHAVGHEESMRIETELHAAIGTEVRPPRSNASFMR